MRVFSVKKYIDNLSDYYIRKYYMYINHIEKYKYSYLRKVFRFLIKHKFDYYEMESLLRKALFDVYSNNNADEILNKIENFYLLIEQCKFSEAKKLQKELLSYHPEISHHSHISILDMHYRHRLYRFTHPDPNPKFYKAIDFVKEFIKLSNKTGFKVNIDSIDGICEVEKNTYPLYEQEYLVQEALQYDLIQLPLIMRVHLGFAEPVWKYSDGITNDNTGYLVVEENSNLLN
jgi:hypothetical protein